MNVKTSIKLILIFTITLNLLYFSLLTSNSKSNIINYDQLTLINNNLKTSQITNKILINGTSDWIDFRNAGNCTGSGTYSDPYVIEDLIIDGGGSGSCIHIENSSVFFRIENCTLFNSGDYSYLIIDAGISLNNVSNGIIKKNHLMYNLAGIVISGSNSTISQNIIDNNLGGIVSDGENILIYNNSVSNNDYGIMAMLGCTILENDINYNMVGISCYENVTVSSNNVSFNKMYGIRIVFGNHISIADNYISNNNGTAILSSASYSEIVRNEINNNKEDGIHLKGSIFYGYYSITSPCHDNLISQNSINNNFCGIRLNITQDTDVTNNSISNNQICGIDVNSSTRIDISTNEINKNYYGIRMIESAACDILQNTINHNHYGVYLNSSIGIDILQNTLHHNRICYFETDDCIGNSYQDNDCIETKNRGLDYLLPLILGIISLSSALGLAIFLYARLKSKQNVQKKSLNYSK
ncbi:MAG: nitrous oxide reductase family maturation protein NosD [Promethearchaeota archaeon]